MKPPRLLQKFARIPRSEHSNAETVSDQLLVERYVIERNEEAFTELVRRHGAMVASVCQRGLQQRHDAEDAFQTTFFILARDAGRIVKRESLGSWLFGVALRVTRKVRSLHARQPVTNAVEGTLAMAPERTPVDDQTAAAIEEVAFLPQRYRMPVVLCWLEGRTQQEAAELLGWPIGSVAGRLSRAKELLRTRLLRRGLETTALTALFGLADASSLTAGQIKQAVQMALSQTQGQRVLALAQGGSSMIWPTTLIGLLLLGGAGAWLGIQGKDQPKETLPIAAVQSSAPLNEKDQVTVEALEGDWLVEEGSWGELRWGDQEYRIKISKETMTFYAPFDSSSRSIAQTRGGSFFSLWGVLGTPLRYQVESRTNPADFKLNFRFPNLFRVRSGRSISPAGVVEETNQKPMTEVMRDGLLRLHDNSLEMIVACLYDKKHIDDANRGRMQGSASFQKQLEELKPELLPRPKDFAPGMQSFVLKLRRATPLDRMQGWWNWTQIHEVTGQPGTSEYFVVRNDKSVFVSPGEPTPAPRSFILKQRGSQLIYTVTGSAIDHLDLKNERIVKAPTQMLIDVNDLTLRTATFGKVVDLNKYPQLGRAYEAYIDCLIPEGATWENLKQYEKDYIIEVKEYRRSSSGMLAQENKDNVLGARPSKENTNQAQPNQTRAPSTQKPMIAAATIQRIFRINQSDPVNIKGLKAGDVVQLQWIPKAGAEGVMLLDQVPVLEVAKLGASKEQDNEEQLAVTLQLTKNEARLLELFVEGGRFQVKLP